MKEQRSNWETMALSKEGLFHLGTLCNFRSSMALQMIGTPLWYSGHHVQVCKADHHMCSVLLKVDCISRIANGDTTTRVEIG
ncbi:hypothetical protein GJ744_006177 [Endocarpon pusillum]|uniref:Uncharacterized protein n=1 Tax=Endocarpon pusillum TaxID=364733 RepID=A0A8H7A851_9EURO|nr:hypothetical protein GJ744_006177 [Endocarpon pusillum]